MSVLTPEPAPEQQPTPSSPLVHSAYSSSTQLIPDSEFPPRYQDQTTANWRASIQSNIVNFNERRGIAKSSRYIG